MYAKGRGVAQDDKQAVYWYQKAADQGDAGAQYNLGEMYQYGVGVAQDHKQAVYWTQKAADQGHKTAERKLGILRITRGWFSR
jgi:TPR repeat protein